MSPTVIATAIASAFGFLNVVPSSSLRSWHCPCIAPGAKPQLTTCPICNGSKRVYTA